MRAILTLIFLTACGAQPAPEFFNATRHEAVRDGRRYVLYQTPTRVEVIRLGYATAGEHRDIRATMIALIPEVTGCRLVARSITGDSGEMRGTIRCKPK